MTSGNLNPPSPSILHLSVTADIVAQLNPRADVEKCAVFTQKRARPALDHRADGGGGGGEGGGPAGQYGSAEAEGYGVGAATASVRPVGLVALLALLALVIVQY